MSFWLPFILSLLVAMALGMLWYGPLFGKRWMRWMRIRPSDVKKSEATSAMIASTATSAVFTATLGVVIALLGAESWLEGVLYGALLWLVVASTSLNQIWFEKQHKGIWALYAGYILTVFLISGALYGALL